MIGAGFSMIKADYVPRPIRFLGLWSVAEFRLKIYSIAHARPMARAELIDATRDVVERHLCERPTRHEHYGVGFVGIHDGRGENQVFLDLWVNQNELLHTYWISPSDEPTKLVRPPEDHNSVCVWDLQLQCIERRAWIDCVIGNANGPDLEAYLARSVEGEF
jgi:hypothetical protein